jgi:hypothetical protein
VKTGFVEMKASIKNYRVNPKKLLMSIHLIAARSSENLTALARMGEIEEAISPDAATPDPQGALPLGDAATAAPSKGRRGKRS